ncbi:unnamed protein product [Arabis nemorensis]|uniref:Uncharacterized protein n=1 Tax=Arabis nemorensis TaxID=586526 RepID=A0A565AY72_9BRAS|nr:unnamed protein product [Arabis nemorensis]
MNRVFRTRGVVLLDRLQKSSSLWGRKRSLPVVRLLSSELLLFRFRFCRLSLSPSLAIHPLANRTTNGDSSLLAVVISPCSYCMSIQSNRYASQEVQVLVFILSVVAICGCSFCDLCIG